MMLKLQEETSSPLVDKREPCEAAEAALTYFFIVKLFKINHRTDRGSNLQTEMCLELATSKECEGLLQSVNEDATIFVSYVGLYALP